MMPRAEAMWDMWGAPWHTLLGRNALHLNFLVLDVHQDCHPFSVSPLVSHAVFQQLPKRDQLPVEENSNQQDSPIGCRSQGSSPLR